MKTLIFGVGLIFIAAACQVEPRPINFGTDSCQTCKMILMDASFGAEVVTQKGKIFIFDDLNCLIEFFGKEGNNHDYYKEILVVNHAKPEQLIPAKNAFYVLSDAIKSPMASRIAAFETETEMKEYRKKYDGFYLAWGELITQFK